MAALASDWLRHFWLLLWNRWTEFDETWQEAKSQRPLQLTKSVFFGPIGKKKRWLPWPMIGWDIFLLLLWNCWTGFKEIWQEVRSQHLPSCVFQSDEKIKITALADLSKGCTVVYSGARYVALWASCLCIYLGEGRWGCTNACICIGTQSQPLLQNCLTDGWSAHDTAHALRCLARSTQGRIQDRAKIGDRGASSRKCFFRLEGYSNIPNV